MTTPSVREVRRIARARNAAHAEALLLFERIDDALAGEDARYAVAELIMREVDEARIEGRDEGYQDGYDEGYRAGSYDNY